MNNTPQPHLFWGSASPLAALSGGGLLIMATVRLSYAIIAGFSLIWVYGLSVLIFHAAARGLPRRGIVMVQTFLASLMAGLYLLVIWILTPITALETFFVVSLVPIFCISSGIFQRSAAADDTVEALTRAISEAVVLSVLLLAFSLVREPLGFLSLSVPGGSRGIAFIFSVATEALFPVQLIASSSGALILLGYGLGLYRYYRNLNAPQEADV